MDGPRVGGCAAWRVGGEAWRAPSGGLRSCVCSRTGWGRHHHNSNEDNDNHDDGGYGYDDDGGGYDDDNNSNEDNDNHDDDGYGNDDDGGGYGDDDNSNEDNGNHDDGGHGDDDNSNDDNDNHDDGGHSDDDDDDGSYDFQIGAGLYAVGRPVQKRNITQQKRTAKSAPITPCPSREGPYSTVFWVSRPMDPLMWLAGLLALSGDVETNPGPSTQTWTCDMCSTEITRRQTSYRCNSSPSHWVHEHCTTLRRNTDYTPTWKCNIHNQQNNTITDQHHQLTNNNNNMQQNLNINQPHSINNNKPNNR